MASIIEEAPPMAIGEAIPIWKKIDWSPEIEQRIYKDWGRYYSTQRRENFALHYYDKALALAPNDFITLYHRSRSKRNLAQTEGAIQDSIAAAKMAKAHKAESAYIELEICDGVYELNEFENCKVQLHNCARQFIGNKAKMFEDRTFVVADNIQDVLGDSLTPFFSSYEKLVCLVDRLTKAANNVDTRPLWKILKEEGKCDIMSILEIEEELLSPLEHARRLRAFNLFHQTYLTKSWVDVLFLKKLRTNPNLVLDYCKHTKGFLSTIPLKQYKLIQKFLKMLQSRTPLYYIRYITYSNKVLLKKYKEDFLFRMQYQTRRNMITALSTVRHLRASKNSKKLLAYVEEIMGDYVVLKTHRVMPWKFEFLNEVYNTLALALIEQYRVPKNFKANDKSALLKLLKLPLEKSNEQIVFVFGDRSTYQEKEDIDPATLQDRLFLSRLEKRIFFTKYHIEKTYLYYQMGDTHLQQNRFDECAFSARKGVEASKLCNSHIWALLNTILMIKSNAVLHKVEKTGEVLLLSLQLAKKLKSPNLEKFLETCLACNEEDLSHKMASVLSARASKNSSLKSQGTLEDENNGSRNSTKLL